MNNKQLIITLCYCLVSSFLYAQTSTIKGKVLDKDTKHTIYKATVVLGQNGKILETITTDFEGNYMFTVVDKGTYELDVVCPRYDRIRKDSIIVETNTVLVYNLEMVSTERRKTEERKVAEKELLLLIEEGERKTKKLAEKKEYEASSTRSKSLRGGNGSIASNNRKLASPSFGYNAAPPPTIHNTSSQNNSIVPESGTEEYGTFAENDFKKVKEDAFSTFSIDVDRASYSNVRRFIEQSQKPPVDAVRIEEMVNYFDYHYPQPTGEHPFSVQTEVSDCPWNKEAKLVKIGLQGKNMDLSAAPATNLVFLIDVSGSMGYANKLPLLKESLKLLINNMRDNDKMALVVYAGAAGLVQASTNDKNKLIAALEALNSGGSTAGGAGINLAYQVAKENFIDGGNNRVIIATDGDFNVGTSSNEDLEKLIVEKRKDNIFLTVLGFGMGNYKDSKMEILADKGNGNYAYIDNIKEAKKTLVNEMGGTLYVIAKDVKLQLEFDSTQVYSYRLVGYENRLLNKEDFEDDTKDAGEMGAGHTVTALYEIMLAKDEEPNANAPLLTLNLRYKQPTGDKSTLFVHPVTRTIIPLAEASENFRFAASVAGFGMLLRDSKFKNDLSYQSVLDLAKDSKGIDKEGYREEFIGMVKNVNSMSLQAGK